MDYEDFARVFGKELQKQLTRDGPGDGDGGGREEDNEDELASEERDQVLA